MTDQQKHFRAGVVVGLVLGAVIFILGTTYIADSILDARIERIGAEVTRYVAVLQMAQRNDCDGTIPDSPVGIICREGLLGQELKAAQAWWLKVLNQ
ncbi:MAG TPA: hypothetical protein VJH69_02075 [Candidatus Paceibacterota bacterium]